MVDLCQMRYNEDEVVVKALCDMKDCSKRAKRFKLHCNVAKYGHMHKES